MALLPHHVERSDADDTIVGISFADVYRAEEFLIAVRRLVANGSVELRDAVSIVKDADGKTMVRETIDPQPLPSALSGAMWAGLIGLLIGGPVGWLAGAAIGAGSGAVTAKIVDLGVPDEWVAWFREAVQAGTATVVLLLGRFDRETTYHELERFAGGHLVYANVGPDAISRMRAALDDDTAPDAPATPLEPVADEATTGSTERMS